MKVNGSLVFDASSASEIQNLRVQKLAGASVPAYTSADAGRMIFVTSTGGGYIANTLYFGHAGSTSWVAVATGGNAAALQTEVDALETSIGAIVDGSGVFQVGAVTGPAFSGSEADLTELLQALSDYANANNELAELDDVTLTSAADNDLLQYNSTGSVWENKAIGSASGVQAYDAGLDALAAKTSTGIVVQTGNDTFTSVSLTAPAAGITITNADGVAGSPTFALANDLAALEGLAANGLIARTGDGSAAVRTITGPSEGITVTNGDGVAGNPTIALANDLAALEGLTTTGYIVRTGDGTATTRSLSVVSGDLVITGDASGVSTDTTFGLDTVTQASSGDFVKVTLDTKGRVIGNTPVVASDITTLVDSTYVNVSGDTMSGNLVMGTNFVTMTNPPTSDTQAANKAYVDAVAQGLSWKQAVVAASTADLTLSGEQTVDGVALVTGDRVLVKDQTAQEENGIYIVDSGAWTRALDMNAAVEFDGSAVFVKQGTVNEGSGWTETATIATVDTDSVVFSQFSGGQAFVWGDGLGNTGNTIYVKMGAGIVMLPSDEVGIDVVANKAVQLTGTATGDQLTFVLDSGSGLEQSATGLKISADGVTNAMILNDTMVVNGDTGTGSLALGGTLEVKGDSVQGIVTSVNGTGTFTVTASTATSSQLGVAKFNTGDFDVTAGDVTIKAAGVDNAQLANSTITLSDGVGSDAVALGETLTFAGGTSVSAAVTANTVTYSVADATDTVKGIASFDAADFTVTSGAVTAVAKSIDAATDVALTSPASGQTLVWDGSNFVNKKVQHVESFTSQTSVTATHGLGQQFVNVTVVEDVGGGDFAVVIPQSITMTATTVVVTFNSAVSGKVIVNGFAGA